MLTPIRPWASNVALGLGGVVPQSFVNLDNYFAAGGRGTATTVSGLPAGFKGYSYFTAAYTSFSIDDPAGDGSVAPSFPRNGSLLARIFVTHGTTSLTFSGLLNLDNGNSPGGTFTATIPEPGTLVPLAAGLMGMLAYAWRKRKY